MIARLGKLLLWAAQLIATLMPLWVSNHQHGSENKPRNAPEVLEQRAQPSKLLILL